LTLWIKWGIIFCIEGFLVFFAEFALYFFVCEYGGTGRRARLKILLEQSSPSSILGTRTIFFFFLLFLFLFELCLGLGRCACFGLFLVCGGMGIAALGGG
jgi:hypothetical protein